MRLRALPLLTLTLLGSAALRPVAAQERDLVGTARAAGSFTTLLAALDAAELTRTLGGRGPFTVLAPTDDAFRRLPGGTVEKLLRPENREQLRTILKYHVLDGRVPAAQVRQLRAAGTLAGQRVRIGEQGGRLTVNDAVVLTADVAARNGIIHVIDQVLLPQEQNVVGVAKAQGMFGTLLAAAEAAGLGNVLAATSPITLFAPTDDAFRRLPAGTVESLLKPENREKLAAILSYHVVAGKVYADQALQARTAKTAQGQPVMVRVVDGGLRVNQSRIIAADVEAANGVIHVIDQVLLPPEGNAGRPAMEGSSTTAARSLARLAIERGVPLFNDGQPEATAAIYEVAATAIAQRDDVSEGTRERLRQGLREARRSHDARDRAWTLRRALDVVVGDGERMEVGRR
ncbi:MAG: fasciclin domain-containing protein [Gemmatimonadales bacterium]|nr:fasciclin domain-containing protein [Gemmatimonadales bacterium]